MLNKPLPKEKKEEIILFILGLAVIVLAAIICGTYKPGLWIEDEFGYFGASALFAGYDWSQLYTSLGYYGFGYGLLMLPAFMLCSSSQQLMSYMIVVNILLLIGSYFFCVRLVRKLYPLQNKIVIYTSIIIASLYINNIAQLHMGWSETINVFLYWWILNAYYDVITKGKIKNYIIISCLLCYLIMVHMRNITVVVPCIIMILIYLVKTRAFPKNSIFYFCFIAIIGAVIFFSLKRYIQRNLYNVIGNRQGNDIISTVSGFSFLGRIDWCFFLSKGLMAKIFYIFSSTYLLIGCGFVGSIKICKNRKYENREQIHYIVIFSILIFITSLALCVINTAIPQRMDTIFYGRYFEPYIGMFLVIGFIYLNDNNESFRNKLYALFIIFLVYKICFLSTDNYFTQSLPGFTGYFTFPCVTGIAKYFNTQIANTEIVKTIFKITLKYAFVILICILSAKKLYNKKYNLKQLVCVIVALYIIFGQVGDAKVVISQMQEYENVRYESVIPLVNAMDIKWNDYSNCEVYYFSSGLSKNPQADILACQFQLGKTPIKVITSMYDIEATDNPIYIILNKQETEYISDKNLIENKGMNFILETEIFELYVIDKSADNTANSTF